MTEEEKQQIVRLVTAEIVKLASAGKLPINPGDLAGVTGEIECFTCSGRFKCKPSFLIQTPPAQPTD